MRRLVLAAALLAVSASLLAGVRPGLYGRPGDANGGLYVTRTTICAAAGVELWGHPGFFLEDEC